MRSISIGGVGFDGKKGTITFHQDDDPASPIGLFVNGGLVGSIDHRHTPTLAEFFEAIAKPVREAQARELEARTLYIVLLRQVETVNIVPMIQGRSKDSPVKVLMGDAAHRFHNARLVHEAPAFAPAYAVENGKTVAMYQDGHWRPWPILVPVKDRIEALRVKLPRIMEEVPPIADKSKPVIRIKRMKGKGTGKARKKRAASR